MTLIAAEFFLFSLSNCQNGICRNWANPTKTFVRVCGKRVVVSWTIHSVRYILDF